MSMRLACVPLFLIASALLYYGTTMLFLVPASPGHYFDQNLLLYGILPTLLSVALLVTVGWLWVRTGGSVFLGKAIGRSFSLAVAAIVHFWIGLIIMADLRQGS